MSKGFDQKAARRIQEQLGVKYQTALSWCRDPAVQQQAHAAKCVALERPYIDVLVESALRMKHDPAKGKAVKKSP